MNRSILLLLAIGVCVGCQSSEPVQPRCPHAWAEPGERVSDDPEGLPDAIDDRQQYNRLLAEAERMHGQRETVPMETLIKQLDRPKVRLRLARPRAKPVSSADLYAQAKNSVLVVGRLFLCKSCKKRHLSTASGFVVSASGAAVTSYHVVDNADSDTLVAMTGDGRIFPVKQVLAASKAHDVAILELAGDGLVPLPIGADAPVGSAVRVISHPERCFYSLTEGIVSRYFTLRRDGQDVPTMTITADFAKGSSGAPVFDARGSVVGLVASTHSIYYHAVRGKPKEDLQMVIKQCVPARGLLAVIER